MVKRNELTDLIPRNTEKSTCPRVTHTQLGQEARASPVVKKKIRQICHGWQDDDSTSNPSCSGIVR